MICRGRCTHANQMHVWIGLRICAMPSVNSLHTIRHEPKFVSFLGKHIGNWVCCVSCVRLKFAEIKFTTHVARTVQFTCSLHVCTSLKVPLQENFLSKKCNFRCNKFIHFSKYLPSACIDSLNLHLHFTNVVKSASPRPRVTDN